MNLKNKNVIITGASSGLGEEVAYQLSKQGANLILLARRMNELERVREKCLKNTENVKIFSVDVSEKEQIRKFLDELEKINNIDVFVSNAGFAQMKYADEFEMDEIEYMFKVNTVGSIMLSTEIAKRMKKNKKGHIVCVSSILGKFATPFSSIYSATKFALIGYFDALRIEMKDYNVKVTTINPGIIATKFLKDEGEYSSKVKVRPLETEEVAQKILKAINSYKAEVNTPFSLNLLSKFRNVFPNFVDMKIYKMFK